MLVQFHHICLVFAACQPAKSPSCLSSAQGFPLKTGLFTNKGRPFVWSKIVCTSAILYSVRVTHPCYYHQSLKTFHAWLCSYIRQLHRLELIRLEFANCRASQLIIKLNLTGWSVSWTVQQTGPLGTLMSNYGGASSPEEELSPDGESNAGHQVILNETGQWWAVLWHQVLEVGAGCNTTISQSEWLKLCICCMMYSHWPVRMIKTLLGVCICCMMYNHQPIKMTETLLRACICCIKHSYHCINQSEGLRQCPKSVFAAWNTTIHQHFLVLWNKINIKHYLCHKLQLCRVHSEESERSSRLRQNQHCRPCS